MSPILPALGLNGPVIKEEDFTYHVFGTAVIDHDIDVNDRIIGIFAATIHILKGVTLHAKAIRFFATEQVINDGALECNDIAIDSPHIISSTPIKYHDLRAF